MVFLTEAAGVWRDTHYDLSSWGRSWQTVSMSRSWALIWKANYTHYKTTDRPEERIHSLMFIYNIIIKEETEKNKVSKCCKYGPTEELNWMGFLFWLFKILFSFFFFIYIFCCDFSQLLCQLDFSHGKFGSPSPGKASSDRVALPNLRCMLDDWVFP